MIHLAGCVIPDKQGNILLIHRNTLSQVQWELPGGKVEDGEDEKNAAIREVYEETDLKVKIVDFIGSANFKENGTEWLYHWYLAEITEGIPKIKEEKFDKLRFLNIEQLDDSEVSKNIRNLKQKVDLRKVLQNE